MLLHLVAICWISLHLCTYIDFLNTQKRVWISDLILSTNISTFLCSTQKLQKFKMEENKRTFFVIGFLNLKSASILVLLAQVIEGTRKTSKLSLVWNLGGMQSHSKDMTSLQQWNVLPYLVPWKRTAYWRSIKHDSAVPKSPFSLIRVLSIGGSNLKWSKSIEARSKKANELTKVETVPGINNNTCRGGLGEICAWAEEATLAVAAVEREKREQMVAGHFVINAKDRRCTYRKSSQDEKSSCSTDANSGKESKISFIPRRLLIGNDEYIRIGNGNQLVRDPKRLTRMLASEKIRWSLHTARLRLARKKQFCQFFMRFGKCRKDDGKCPYIHDPDKVAVCTKFLKGVCSDAKCKLTHKDYVPMRVVHIGILKQLLEFVRKAAHVEDLLGGVQTTEYCRKKHSYVCPLFKANGMCPRGSACKLHHPKNGNKGKKRKRAKKQKNGRGRYFGSPVPTSICLSEKVASGECGTEQGGVRGDVFFYDGRYADYISLDASDVESKETNTPTSTTMSCGGDSSDLCPDDLDMLMKPVRIMNENTSADSRNPKKVILHQPEDLDMPITPVHLMNENTSVLVKTLRVIHCNCMTLTVLTGLHLIDENAHERHNSYSQQVNWSYGVICNLCNMMVLQMLNEESFVEDLQWSATKDHHVLTEPSAKHEDVYHEKKLSELLLKMMILIRGFLVDVEFADQVTIGSAPFSYSLAKLYIYSRNVWVESPPVLAPAAEVFDIASDLSSDAAGGRGREEDRWNIVVRRPAVTALLLDDPRRLRALQYQNRATEGGPSPEIASTDHLRRCTAITAIGTVGASLLPLSLIFKGGGLVLRRPPFCRFESSSKRRRLHSSYSVLTSIPSQRENVSTQVEECAPDEDYTYFLSSFKGNNGSNCVDGPTDEHKFFLEHLREDGNSYVLEMMDLRTGMPIFVKYELDDSSSDGTTEIASESSSNIHRRRGNAHAGVRGKKSYESRFVNHEQNKGLTPKSEAVSVSFSLDHENKNGVPPQDDSYQVFINHVRLHGDSVILELDGFSVKYEEEDENLSVPEGLSAEKVSHQNEPRVNSESTSYQPSDAVPGDNGGHKESWSDGKPSYFKTELMKTLNKPYKQREHKDLWEKATECKALHSQRHLRTTDKSYPTTRDSMSYLDYYPGRGWGVTVLDRKHPSAFALSWREGGRFRLMAYRWQE
ncbi:hypothetical protein ACLOJK_014010 [Asimina triloba]